MKIWSIHEKKEFQYSSDQAKRLLLRFPNRYKEVEKIRHGHENLGISKANYEYCISLKLEDSQIKELIDLAKKSDSKITKKYIDANVEIN